MKIEKAPWIKKHFCDMEDLYTELTLEKIRNKPTGLLCERLSGYAELFVERLMTKRVLFKGDPGMGKSTLMKKIAWDWAKGFFKVFIFVFVVFLKLVKPDDTIEKAIIDQYPEFEGVGLTAEKLRVILETFGNKTLLILDGLDEHAVGQNVDVLKIVQRQKISNCTILLTSRPHSIKDIERYFPTVVRVDGFTREKAQMFASKILGDTKRVQEVLDFNPSDFRQDVSLYECPILLSFMCLLIQEDYIDLATKTMETGEIYTRMVRCLYKKFTIRKNIEYENTEFARTVTKIGKLAFETLLSGKPLLRRSQVIKDIGPEAFDYGLLIGHEDFRLIRDETADIFITFPHRTIQEFLGAFYFIMMLNAGVSVESLLGSDCKEPLFMMNHLFLHFCLWFLYSKEKYFTLENRDKISESLISYCRKQLGSVVRLETVTKSYPAFDIEGAVGKNDTLGLKFFKDVLQTVKVLIVKLVEQLEWILSVINPELTNIAAPLLNVNHINDGNITVNIRNVQVIFPELCRILAQCAKVHLQIFQTDQIIELPDVQEYGMISSLSLISCQRSGICAREMTLKKTPNLTHSSLVNLFINQPTCVALYKVVSKSASYLSLANCESLSAKLPKLFESKWPKLSHLNMLKTKLNYTDVRDLFEAGGRFPNLKSLILSNVDFLPKNPCLNLTSLCLDLSEIDSSSLVGAIYKGMLPNLKSLGISMGKKDPERKILEINLESLSLKKLHSLTLHHCITKHISLDMLATYLELHKLNISHSSGIKGKLHKLFARSFPSMNSLILSGCCLNSEDLCNLAQASVEGKLPHLKHLDISQNWAICFDDMFQASCTWHQLIKLNIAEIGCKSSDQMTEKMRSGSLHLLHEISVSDDQILSYKWQKLQRICLFNKDLLDKVANAIDEDRFPALCSVCFQSLHSTYIDPLKTDLNRDPAVHKLVEKNISVHTAFLPYHDLFTSVKCLCQLDE